MNIDTIRAFFMWCSIINGAILILSSLIRIKKQSANMRFPLDIITIAHTGALRSVRSD